MTDEEEGLLPAERRRPRLPSLFTPSADAASVDPDLGERMRTLDTTERKWGFGASAFVLALSCLLIPSLLRTTSSVTKEKLNQTACIINHYTWIPKTKSCELIHLYHPSDFALEFVLLVVIGSVLLFAVWRSMRALTIFTSIFVGLAALFVGIVIVGFLAMGYGFWLLTRSWRLQRFGAKDSRTVRKVSMERSEERREAKREARQSGSRSTPATIKSGPTPSKRYTPKSKPRRR